MSSKLQFAVVAAVLCGVPSALYATGSILAVPTQANSIPSPTFISGDGQVMVGSERALSASHTSAFRWTAAGGMQYLGALGTQHSFGRAINEDGSVIAGSTDVPLNGGGYVHAFRWTTSGMQDLGTLGGSYSHGYGVSGNGQVVVGASGYTSSTSNPHAFRWTVSGGMQDLGTLGGSSSYARATNGDGSVVVGYSESPLRAFRWTASGGMQNLGTLPGNVQSRASAVSSDGSVIAGISYPLRAPSRAVIWRNGAIQDIGNLGASTVVNAISGDGYCVAGYYMSLTGGGQRACIWTPKLGMVDLETYATQVGVDMTGWSGLTQAQSVNFDGSIVSGYGSFNGISKPFIISGLPAAIPAPASALILAFGGCIVTRRRSRMRL